MICLSLFRSQCYYPDLLTMILHHFPNPIAILINFRLLGAMIPLLYPYIIACTCYHRPFSAMIQELFLIIIAVVSNPAPPQALRGLASQPVYRLRHHVFSTGLCEAAGA